MKIKFLLFTGSVIMFVAIVSYYLSGSIRGRNSDQLSTHTIKKQLEYAVNSSIEEEIKANLIACHVEQIEIFSNMAAKIKYESAVLTKTGNGKYMGFVKVSTGDIIKVDILIDDENFYYETKDGWKNVQQSIVNERHKMGILSDFERSQAALRKSIEEFEIRNNITPTYRTYQPIHPKSIGTVTGILSSDGIPLVAINGEVFREGQNINGVKVVKINQDSVEFEFDKDRWSQKVNEPPSSFWP